MEEFVLEPQAGMQTEVILCPAFEVLMGGQAGPGKSWTLLFLDIPDLLDESMGSLRVLYLRREYVDLGDLIDKAMQMWLPLGAVYAAADSRYGKKTTFTWPNGAKCIFGHCQRESDKYQYQGFEFQRLRVDELAQFTESQYLYLFSRMRSADPKLRINVRSSCNPQGVGMLWLKRRFVDQLAPGEIKWFTRNAQGRDMVTAPDDPHALSRAWVPGDRRDNRYIGEQYERNLRQLTQEDYHALALGIWEIKDKPSQLIEAKWFDWALSGGDPAAQRRDNTKLSLLRRAIGADFAHEGQDMSVMAWGEGPKLLGMEGKGRTRTEEFCHWVGSRWQELGEGLTDVAADGIGPGTGACDMLESGARVPLPDGRVIVVPRIPNLCRLTFKDPAFDLKYRGAYKFPNLRSQMWWKLRQDLERGLIDLSALADPECRFDDLGTLQEEVLSITYEVEMGEIKVASKKMLRKADNLGRSPDWADALAGWNWARNRDKAEEKPTFEREIQQIDGYTRSDRSDFEDWGDGTGWA